MRNKSEARLKRDGGERFEKPKRLRGCGYTKEREGTLSKGRNKRKSECRVFFYIENGLVCGQMISNSPGGYM